MSTKQSSPAFGLGRILRRSLVSAFVLVSYLAYAVHEHFAAPAQDAAALPPAPQPGQGAQPPQAGQAAPATAGQDQIPSTATPDVTSGTQYKNGTFTGAPANAFYGEVQVQVVISNGRISSITFLNYPSDRRTSARINSIAIPWLQSEAIQAQSANVDIISGATLTSEAFMVSLQSALENARS